jgi:hypothetical protein
VKFDVYGRFQLEVVRENDSWAVYRLAPGKRVRTADFIIPPELEPNEVAGYLDDLFHEQAVPGKRVRLFA